MNKSGRKFRVPHIVCPIKSKLIKFFDQPLP